MATFSSLDFTIPYNLIFRSVSGPFLLLSEELAIEKARILDLTEVIVEQQEEIELLKANLDQVKYNRR